MKDLFEKTFRAKIIGLEEKATRAYLGGFGPDAVFETVSEGWWAMFDGWPASMRVTEPFENPVSGAQRVVSRKPVGLEVGDVVELTLRKVVGL